MMEDKYNLIVLKVSGKGCGSCVLPIRNHLYRVKGVYGVHVKGHYVYVLASGEVTASKLLLESRILDYYFVEVVDERKISGKRYVEEIVHPLTCFHL